MSLKPKTFQACAACKYQRRKCTKDCPLTPYFPGDQPEKFQNAHRLFGVSNILKILKRVPKELHEEAMESVIYESDMRARFPVHGCREVICRLLFQLEQKMEELNYVRSCLATCQNQCKHQMNPPSFDFYSSPQLDLHKGYNDHGQSKAITYHQQDYVFQEEKALLSDDNKEILFGRIGSDGQPYVELKDNTNTNRSGESSAVK